MAYALQKLFVMLLTIYEVNTFDSFVCVSCVLVRICYFQVVHPMGGDFLFTYMGQQGSDDGIYKLVSYIQYTHITVHSNIQHPPNTQ